MYDNLHWLMQHVGRCLIRRRDDLRNKNTGAIPSEHTRVIWVAMLARPISDDPDLSKIWKLRRKFNEVLADPLEIENYMHIMTIKDMEEDHYFDSRGNLTIKGQQQYWLNLNDQLKAFEYHSTDLRPARSENSFRGRECNRNRDCGSRDSHRNDRSHR